jgi:hypothetical protein
LHDRQQPRRGEFSGFAAVPETDLAPLDGGSQDRSTELFVGSTPSYQENEEPLEIEEQRPGEIAYVPIRVVQMGFRQSEQLLL